MYGYKSMPVLVIVTIGSTMTDIVLDVCGSCANGNSTIFISDLDHPLSSLGVNMTIMIGTMVVSSVHWLSISTQEIRPVPYDS